MTPLDDYDGPLTAPVRRCTCAGTAPGYPQHEPDCGQEQDAEEAYSSEDRALIESVSAGHVLTAIHEALKLGEMETVVELLGILAAKDPHAADLIVKTIQYRGSAR